MENEYCQKCEFHRKRKAYYSKLVRRSMLGELLAKRRTALKRNDSKN